MLAIKELFNHGIWRKGRGKTGEPNELNATRIHYGFDLSNAPLHIRFNVAVDDLIYRDKNGAPNSTLSQQGRAELRDILASDNDIDQAVGLISEQTLQRLLNSSLIVLEMR